MTYIAKCNKGSIDLTEYETVDAAIAAVEAFAEVVRIDRPRANYAMIVCSGGKTYSVVEVETVSPVTATATAPKSSWAKHVEYCRVHHEGDTDMPSPYANR